MKPLLTLFLPVLSCFCQTTPGFKIHLHSNLPSPQPVGTVIGLMPAPENAKQGPHAFRYSVSVDGGAFRIVRDFSPDAQLNWRPELFEHEAVVRVAARNNITKETAQDDLPFRIESRIKDSQAVVTPTVNPLVALFSAPPCTGGQFRVAFQKTADGKSSHTPQAPCGPRSNNVYVAGMRADSEYRMRGETVNGSDIQAGRWIPFHTGLLDGNFPMVRIVGPATPESSQAEPVLLLSMLDPFRIMATDLDGHVIWYLPSMQFLSRMLPGGGFLGIGDGSTGENDIRRWQAIREFDLAGNVTRETNMVRLAEQLEARGIASSCKKGSQQCVTSFHHEAIRLPNGHTVTVAGLERMFPAGTQGSKEPVDIIGDLVLDLDPDFQLAWFWNAFDHMDIKRASISGEKCKAGPGDDGCTPVFLADAGNGWLHTNSLNYIQGEGNLLLSIPEQDWVVKIDYQDGKGSGKILWKLGAEGDFAAKSDDRFPWFSYQHDVGFEPPGSNMLTLMDDGRARKRKFPEANNRVQVWKLDETAHTAALVTNADLGVFSFAVGSAQVLKNGNVTGEAGLVNPGPGLFSRAVEVTPQGKIAYAQQIDGALVYRSFRVADLYSPPDK